MPPKPSEKRTRVSSSEEEISAHVLVDDAILKDIQKLETLDMLDKINNIKSDISIITYEVIFLFQDIILTLLGMATSETGLARTRQRAAKPRSREGQGKGELATIPYKFSFVLRLDEGKYHWLKNDVPEIKVD